MADESNKNSCSSGFCNQDEVVAANCADKVGVSVFLAETMASSNRVLEARNTNDGSLFSFGDNFAIGSHDAATAMSKF